MSHIKSNATAGGTVTSFPSRAIAITPSDATEFDLGVQVYAGTGGTVVVEPYGGGDATVTFNVPDGGYVPCVVRRVLAASTATDLVGVY